ncbi:MAG: HD domain-containing protein [Patescibacteria group bacterium]|nr:HD domain-containing protein [Patescibacteria group bacterium]
MQNLDPIVEKIINNPLFLRLKDVIENNAYHDHEKTYDHLIKTYETAKTQIKGDFISNPQAKKLFLEFVNTPFENLTNGDVMLLTALLHDVGKILYYKDGGKEFPLRHENAEGIVSNPGHEYWGSTIVREFVKDATLSEKVIEKIAKVIRLHDTLGAHYFNPILNWPIELIVDDVKARAEGFYKEALFNHYCDCFTAKPFEESKRKIIQVFNEPTLYSPREYFIK